MLNKIANFLDDLSIKLDILTFRINQKIKVLDKKHDREK